MPRGAFHNGERYLFVNLRDDATLRFDSNISTNRMFASLFSRIRPQWVAERRVSFAIIVVAREVAIGQLRVDPVRQ